MSTGNSSAFHHSNNSSEDFKGTPRKESPRRNKISMQPGKTQELSLSDVEFKSQQPRRRSHVLSNVLVVEADNRNMDKSGEVETRSFSIHSPVKVIRHSRTPSPTDSPEHVSKDRKSHPKSFSYGNISPISNEKPKSTHARKTPQSQDKLITTKKGKDSESKNTSSSKKADSAQGGSKKKKVQVESRYKQPSKKLTSTPYLLTSMYEKQVPQDGTILDQLKEKSKREPPPRKKITKKDFKGKKDTQLEASKKDESTDLDNENENLLVDLHYARLLQCCYLKLKVQETIEIQEKLAKQEIYSLWVKNRKLEKEIEALKYSFVTKKIELAVDQLIPQLEKLKPMTDVSNKCSKLEESFSNISHYLPMENVILDEDELLQSLQDSKKYLAGIRRSTHKNSVKLGEFTMSCQRLSEVLHDENKENISCRQSLVECERLHSRERSLLTHRLQENQDASYVSSFAVK